MNGLSGSYVASRRLLDPADTLRRVAPLFPQIGLTRISNQTGLDRLGVPVVTVCRPNARSNAVCQGKGLTLAAAKASGVMESIETYCAERIALPRLNGSQHQLAAQHQIVDIERLSRIAGSGLTPDTELSWIEARDIISQQSQFVPFALVHADFTVPYPSGTGHFLLNTTGLASGNTYEEAVLHGLCEVIERDAMTLANLDLQGQKESRVDLDTINDQTARDLIGHLVNRDVLVAMWDITSDVSVPTFKCQIMDRDDAGATANLLAEGYGCHPSREVALLRAITEAAQSRLAAIAGSRDDIGPAVYEPVEHHSMLRAWRRYLSEVSGNRDYTKAPHIDFAMTGLELNAVVGRLSDAGLHEVLVVDVSAFPTDICSVVRVIVPGLEGPMHPHFVPGVRARRIIGRRT